MMNVNLLSRWLGCGSGLLIVLLLLAGCDLPTEGPSFETETEVNTPLVAQKTFSFLGGPGSEHEPLVDTTTATFDSLFTVGDDPKDITIEQTVDQFNIGELNEAFNQAAGDLSFDKKFAEPLIRNSELAAQAIDARYSRSNQVDTSGGTSVSPGGLYDGGVDQDGTVNDEIVVDFPNQEFLGTPDFGAVDASGATVDSVRLNEDGAPINQITFTLKNDGGNTLTGKGGTGTPKIEVVDPTTGLSKPSDFGAEIPPGKSEETTVEVAEQSLGADTQFKLLVSGTDASNTVTLETVVGEWRYQAAMLSNAGNVAINVSNPSVRTLGSGASQFEGLEVKSGGVDLVLNNQFSFDLEVSQIKVQNNPISEDWVSIPALDIDRSIGRIDSGTEVTESFDLTGKGIASSVSVDVSASPVSDRITITADDVFEVSNTGTLAIQTMYFRPQGEEVQASGTIEMTNDRVTFEEGDYLELANGLVDVSQFAVDPFLTFEEFTLSYPDLRHPPYAPEDSVVIRFVKNPSGDFEFDQVVAGEDPRDFQILLEDKDIRVAPTAVSQGTHEVAYTLRGTLESGDGTRGIVSIDDQVSANMSVGEFDIQELKVSQASSFNVPITQDANGDGALDVSDDAEVRVASLDGFSGIASRIENLQLSGSNLNFSLNTKNLTGTQIRLYSALQGKNNKSDGFYLSGTQNTDRGVSTTSFEKDFVDQGTSLSNESLIKFGVNLENIGLGVEEQHSLDVNDENSNVSRFISRLPTAIRLAGQAEMNGDGGGLALRKPVTMDAGFSVRVPLQFEGQVVLHDTIEADFSSLNDLTDPDKSLNVTEANFEFAYANALPLGADVEMTIVDETGSTIERFTPEDGLRLDPAPRNEDGSGAGFSSETVEGSVTLPLGKSKEALNALAQGKKIRLKLTLTQTDQPPPARARADDTIRLSLKSNIKASVRVGE